MRGQSLPNRGLDSADVRLGDEDDEGCLGVPPGQVRKQLVDLLEELLGSIPDHAFCDEDVLLLVPQEDVRLAFLVEGLPGGGAFEQRDQMCEEEVSKVFLTFSKVDARMLLPSGADLMHGVHDVFVGLVGESELRLERRSRSEGFGPKSSCGPVTALELPREDCSSA